MGETGCSVEGLAAMRGPLPDRSRHFTSWSTYTNYDGETFFVRHAYFTGADEPYDQLQRALKAEINEEAWASLYSTISRPFDPPATGRIAVRPSVAAGMRC